MRSLFTTGITDGGQPLDHDYQYVYIRSEPGLYTVGFFEPSGKWNPESDHDERELAAQRVHYLNGGK